MRSCVDTEKGRERSPKCFLNGGDDGTALPGPRTSNQELSQGWGSSGSCFTCQLLGKNLLASRSWARRATWPTPPHPPTQRWSVRWWGSLLSCLLCLKFENPLNPLMLSSSSNPPLCQLHVVHKRFRMWHRQLLSYLCEQDNKHGRSRWNDLERLWQRSFNIVMWSWYESPLSRTKKTPLWLQPDQVVLITHQVRVNHRWKGKRLGAGEDHFKSP